ncbi:glycosyltransferase family 39 protein [Rhizobium sp. BE258]|uniref:glycosyltransferase family 39 protein n=1 Tax=Rhizobium sp. BE258 TaxID=2817722 RepID=UPI00286BC266|nr:glycosyltransferase family 39 protein [Rhizobium sp. BE258]
MTASSQARTTTVPAWLFALLASYFAVHVVVRLMLPATLGIDEAQQVFRLQWLAAGYGEQPPFYNWLQYAVFSVAGVSVATLAIVKNAMLFGAYVFFALTARMLLHDRMLVVAATLGLLTIPQVAFEMQRDLTHSVALFFASSMFIYGYVLTLKRPSLASYALTGLAIGIGMLSKYNFPLLPATAFLAALTGSCMRKRIFDRRLLVTAAIAIALPLPHALWLKDHLTAASEGTLGKLTENDAANYPLQLLAGMGSFAEAIAGFVLATALIFAVTFRKALFNSLTASSRDIALVERILLFSAVAILALIVFGHATNIKGRWLIPILFVAPLYLCMKIEAAGVVSWPGVQRLMAIIVFAMVALPIAMAGRIVTAGLTHNYERGNVPYRGLAEMLKAQGSPGLIVVTKDWTGGNLRLQFPDVPVISPLYPPGGTKIDAAENQPMLLVWNIESKDQPVIPLSLREWLTSQKITPAPQAVSVDVPYHYGADGDTYRFGYAWVDGSRSR